MLQRNLTVKVSLLSDLHIGTGVKLVRGLDWITRNDGYTYLANSAAIAETILDRALADGKDERHVINVITGLTLDELVDAGWLTAADFVSPSPMFPHRARGTPASSEIREQIKDVHGRPYLPGSTLKGALRTVIATTAADAIKPSVKVEDLDGRRAWAARPVEKALFGSDPNHDFLRMLQVGDSQPVAANRMGLRRAHIYPTASTTTRGRSQGLDVDIQIVLKGTEFVLPIHLPVELIEQRSGGSDERRQQELSDWERRTVWLEKLAISGRNASRQLLTEEVTYFQTRSDVPAVHAFYNRIVDQFSKLQKNQFMLPIGWGGGWHTKTISRYLRQDQTNFEKIVKQYRLDPTGTRKPGDRFPKSRHLLRQPDGQPGEPLGWVLLEVLASG
jgi:CRISPR-associated protein Csm5